MAIDGQQVIGIQNEPTDSDSLFVAFNKTKTNFATLFACASPYNTFNGNGISCTTNANAGSVEITNTGVTKLTAGTGISLSRSNGNVTISSTGGNGNGSGTVSSVGVSSTTLTVATTTGGNIINAGNIIVNLGVVGTVTSGVYTYPTVTVDKYGRVTNIANAASVGTVTSVGLTPGTGIQITGGPVVDSGNITVVNTGVTRLNAGTGISLSSSNGNITITSTAATNPGTVTSIGINSSSLVVSSTPVTTTGNLTVNLPTTITLTGNITGSNLNTSGVVWATGNITGSNLNTSGVVWATGNITGGNLIGVGNAAINGDFVSTNGRLIISSFEDLANGATSNLLSAATYFSTSAAETGTLTAGITGQIKTFMKVGNLGDMVITVTNAGWKATGTGTMTFDTIGAACIMQYMSNKWFCIGNNGVVFA